MRLIISWVLDHGLRRGGSAGAACGQTVARIAPVRSPRTVQGAARDRNGALMAPEGGTTGLGGEPLGDKLAKSDGVLCPPDHVDPRSRADPRYAAIRR